MVLTFTEGHWPANTPRPTALWVVPVSELGGVARHVLDVAAVGLPGWRLVILCPEGPLAAALRAEGAAVCTGPFGPALGFRTSLRTIRKALTALRPDVVHSHLAYADIVAAAATIGRHMRLATTEHGIAADDNVYHGSILKAQLMAFIHRRRLHATDIVIAVSEATKTAMIQKWRPRQQVVVIRNGVDAEIIRSRLSGKRQQPATAPRILSLSRLSPEKQIPVLLRAFREIRITHPAATLTIAGDGPELHTLEAAARELGISDAVTFPGFVIPDAAMNVSDVIVQLSVWENCSYTLLDAIAAGLGVVATPVGGNPEMLPNQCLTEAHDPREVAETIRTQTKIADRPQLDPLWPTRAKMASEIAEAYGAGYVQ